MPTRAQPDDLLAFLRAQLDDDERVARAAANEDPPPWHIDEHDGRIKSGPYTVVHIEDSTPQPPVAQHIARHDPARVLAEVDAKRRILDEHNDPISDGRTLRPGGETIVCGTCHEFGLRDEHQPWPCATLRLLALPYAGRDGYRSEWAPDDLG